MSLGSCITSNRSDAFGAGLRVSVIQKYRLGFLECVRASPLPSSSSPSSLKKEYAGTVHPSRFSTICLPSFCLALPSRALRLSFSVKFSCTFIFSEIPSFPADSFQGATSSETLKLQRLVMSTEFKSSQKCLGIGQNRFLFVQVTEEFPSSVEKLS